MHNFVSSSAVELVSEERDGEREGERGRERGVRKKENQSCNVKVLVTSREAI